MNYLHRSAISGLCLVVHLSAAHAQDVALNPSLSKTWTIEAGAVFRSLDGELFAVTSAARGGSYDLSRLGLDDRDTSFSANLRWRFSDRWRLDLAYDEFGTEGGHANSSDIEFGRITIPKGYELASSLETRTYSAFIGYSFSTGREYELGGRLGLNVVDSDASVGGYAYLGNTRITAGPETFGMTKLIPTLGVYGIYAFNDRLAFEGGIDGIAGSLGAYSGHFLQLNGGLKYWFTDTFALSGGYRFLDVKSERDGDVMDNGFQIQSHGAYMKASVGF